MKKEAVIMTTVMLSILSGIFTACEKRSDPLPGDPVQIELSLKQKEVIESANEFAFSLFKPLVADAKGSGNIMISPFSVSSALSMTLNGASGETFEAMKDALAYSDKTLEEINETYLKLMNDMISVDPRVVMEIANSVWVEKNLTVKQPFMNSLETWYKAEARSFDVTDPAAVKMVNDWIAGKTHDKIKNMLESLDPDIAMLLVNAVYFKGKWRNQFDPDETGLKPFYVTGDAPVQVQMMHQKENFRVVNTGNATLVELPYGQGNYSMVVMLPDVGVTLSEALQLVTPENWYTWMTNLENAVSEVDLSLPRFKYEYKRKLNDDLTNLGMGVAFNPMLADFSNMCDRGLFISFVLHQTFIETNEEGTEAAAATIVGMELTSVPNTRVVNVNRPFLYFIRETTTGTIVFMGQVTDPSV